AFRGFGAPSRVCAARGGDLRAWLFKQSPCDLTDAALRSRIVRVLTAGPPMICAKCQHENRPHAKFCEECAAPLPLTCANCGSEVIATAKFCPECGHAI